MTAPRNLPKPAVRLKRIAEFPADGHPDVKIKAEMLTAEAFAPYGDVIEPAGQPDMIINQGMWRAVS